MLACNALVFSLPVFSVFSFVKALVNKLDNDWRPPPHIVVFIYNIACLYLFIIEMFSIRLSEAKENGNCVFKFPRRSVNGSYRVIKIINIPPTI